MIQCDGHGHLNVTVIVTVTFNVEKVRFETLSVHGLQTAVRDRESRWWWGLRCMAYRWLLIIREWGSAGALCMQRELTSAGATQQLCRLDMSIFR